MMKKLHVVLGMLLCCLFVLAGCGKSATEEAAVNVDLNEVMTKIREAYGENYLPNAAIDNQTLQDMFGLDLTLIEEAVAEMPMIGFHPDRVIVIKAVEGKGEDVEAQLTALRTTLVDDSFQYHANIAKTEASQVVRHGDYVAFLLVGAPNDNMDASEEEQLKFAQEETQKAVDAFNSFFE